MSIIDTDSGPDASDENAEIGSTIGLTVFSLEPDASSVAVEYSLTSNPGGLFAIDPATGIVTVAAAIDRENIGAIIVLQITATAEGESPSVQTFSVTINDVNEFAVSPVTDNDAAANFVDENAAIGTSVGLAAFAVDADAETSAVHYALTSNPGELFAIDPDTGVVTVAVVIDRETVGPTIIVEVTATSDDGSTSAESFSVSINDLNEFAVSATTDTDAAADAVNENAVLGSFVGITGFATDADATDTVHYALTSNPGNLFAVDANSGTVTVAAAINRETVGSSITLELTAISADGSTSAKSFDVAINDANEFDVSAITDTDSAADAVNENAAIGGVVGITAFATDADATTNAVHYGLTSNPGNLFAIDANTGVVTVAAAINRETIGSTVTLEVTATSADGSTSAKNFDVAINDANEFVVSTITDADAAADAVNENAALGSVVGITAFATDADATTNAVHYGLTSNPGNLFAIDANTGVVTVAAAINRETVGSSIALEVTATSADGSTSAKNFDVAISDVNESAVSAITDTDSAADAVSENAALGSLVGITASAADTDATTNAVHYGLTSNPGNLFAIDANTGVVTVAAAINRETVGTSVTLEVTATSADGSTSAKNFDVAINDINEFAVSAITDTDSAADAVSENAAIGGVVGITAFATDADTTTNAVHYALTSNPGNLFAIDANTGVVTVASAINRETVGSSVALEVTATSADGSTSAKNFTVAVNDINEFAVSAITDPDAAADAVNENAAIGSVVGITASATDADAATNAIHYALTSNPGNLFAIDANTGVVTVASAINRETVGSSVALEVTATSDDGSTSVKNFTVAVNDINEFAVSAITDIDAAADAVNENASVGARVGVTAFATDADAADTVHYGLTSNPGNLFTIDANTGVVTVAAAINRETVGSSVALEVTATSADGSTSAKNFDVAIGDVNESAVSAITDTDSAADAVSENAALGSVIGITAFAADADATANAVHYGLTSNPGNLFAIDANTGVVTVAAAINRETIGSSVTLEVTATSADGSTSAKNFTVAVNDINEFPVSALSDADAAADAVDENASIGTRVGITGFATDADATDTVHYALTSNPGSLFAIDANTGIVTVASAIDRETVGSSVALEVTATSADGSTSAKSFTVAVNDLNEFPVSALSDADAAADAVDENASIGTRVGITAFATDADATDTVHYALTSNPGSLFAIDAGTGIVTVASAIDRETVGSSVALEVTATSADGSTSAKSFTVAVNDLNDSSPTFTSPASVSIAENTEANAIVYTATATDPDTIGTLAYSLGGVDAALFSIDSVSGVVRLLASPDYEVPTDLNHDNDYQLVVHASDGIHDTAFGVVVHVTPVNEAPIARDDAGSAIEATASAAGTNAAGNVLANDIDYDANTALSVAAIRTGSEAGTGAWATPGVSLAGQYGTLTLNADGSYVYVANDADPVVQALNAGESLTDFFSYIVQDQGGLADTASLAVSISGRDDSAADITVGAVASVTENIATETKIADLQIVDADAFHGTVTVSDPRFTYKNGALYLKAGQWIDRELDTNGFVLPADFNPATATLIAIGSGGDGGNGNTLGDSKGSGGSGGGAGAFAELLNTQLAAGTALGIHVGAHGSLQPTLVVDNSGNTILFAAAGRNGSSGTITGSVPPGGKGGLASDSIGTLVYSGGDGGGGDRGNAGGGGGAAGPDGVGRNGGSNFAGGVGRSAGGGGGADGLLSTAGRNAGGGSGTFGDGGDGPTGTPGGSASSTTGVDGSNGSNGSGGGGGFNDNSTPNIASDGGDGSMYAIWTDTATGQVAGPGSGGGGGAGHQSVINGAAFGGEGGDAGGYGGGGGGGGGGFLDKGDGGNGSDGILILTYTVNGVQKSLLLTPDMLSGAHGDHIDVTITVTDGPSTVKKIVSVPIFDANEYAISTPIDANGAPGGAVSADADIGTTVGITASARDADTTNSQVTYSLVDNAGGLFRIDTQTGIVTTAMLIDAQHEGTTQHVTVRAASQDGSSAISTFAIAINDVNDYAATVPIDTDSTSNGAAVNAAAGVRAGITAYSVDHDAKDNLITYSLVNPTGEFVIDPATGIVTVGALSPENGATRTITIKATSQDGSSATADFTLKITGIGSTISGTGTLSGTSLADVIFGSVSVDKLDGGAGNDIIYASDGDDQLIGGAGQDTLRGELGNDKLDGGLGLDVMYGGAGNDSYTVDSSADLVIESPNEGVDLVSASVSYILAANVENLTMMGGTAISGTGNALNNVITGNTGANLLSGGDGNDSIVGGTGNDQMYGGTGNDTIGVDAAGDQAFELANEGIDLISASVSYTLGANFENLTLTGSSGLKGSGNELANIITGNSGANSLMGGAGNDTVIGGSGGDTLRGEDGDDSLDGGVGTDILYGGAGNDIFVVDVSTDQVIESLNEGSDLVNASASFTLGSNIENLTFTGSAATNGVGNDLANIITGNSGANSLSGGIGTDTLLGGNGNDSLNGGADNDCLNGGAGGDVMTGGAGDDVYVVDAATDQVIEAANEGIDSVNASVTFTLGSNLENLTLTGAGTLSGTGNALANIIIGNSGNNTLNGIDGDDSLYGFLGNDSLNGGLGNDTLDAGDGNDKLSGGSQNDVLFGGIGNDTIEGNDGRDIVSGGVGADRFVFRLIDLVSGPLLDEIVDFSHAETDKIDLSLIDAIAGGVDNAFTFIGSAAFSGAAGQLHYVANPAGGVIVEGSIAGGGTIDFKIQVDGVNSLVAGDFVL